MTIEGQLKNFLSPEFLFSSSDDQEESFHQDDLIQLFVFGLSLNTESQRPFLLLKDAKQELTLPVAINPLEAGVTLTQSSQAMAAATPHRFSKLLLDSLGIEVRQCVFVQIKGAHQYVRLYISGHPSTNSLKLRADEAMSLVLSLGIPIYASREFINRSRVLTAEIEGLAKGLNKNPTVLNRNHHYLM